LDAVVEVGVVKSNPKTTEISMSEQSVPSVSGSRFHVFDTYGRRPIVQQPGDLLHIHRNTSRQATFTFSSTLTNKLSLSALTRLAFAWDPGEGTLVLKTNLCGSKVYVRRRSGEAHLTKTLDAGQLDSLMKYAETALFRVDVRVQPTGTEIIVRDQVQATPKWSNPFRP